ncbi:MAG: 50S ribosomal protein L29 [Candidatus Gracilibacteria bacterium]
MAEAKIYTIEELRKMNDADKTRLLRETESTLALMKLAVRTGKEKQSHKLKFLSLQIARLNTPLTHKKNEK